MKETPKWFSELKDEIEIFAFVYYEDRDYPGHKQYVFSGSSTVIIKDNRIALKEYDPAFAVWPIDGFGTYFDSEAGASCFHNDETLVVFNSKQDYNAAINLLIEDIRLSADAKTRVLDKMKI